MPEDREITIRLSARNLTSAEFQKARSELAGVRQAADDAGRSAGGAAGFFKSAAGSLAGFLGGAAILGGIRAGLSAVAGGAIGMNAELEKSTLQFTTLIGDAGQAREHVRSLFEFAKRTPFETGPIIEASKMLQTFGGAALNTQHNLELIGDAAAATGAPINELGFWVGRMYAALQGGQPFGESAMRLQELAVLTPAARAEMEAMQKAGKSAEEVFAVFQGRLGEFGGAMVAQANTWEGLKSSITDAVNIMMADALKPLFDLVKVGAQVVLAALGSDGMERAFTSLRDTVGGALGSGNDGGVGIVKGFVNGLLTGVDLGLGALGAFGQGWGGLKTIVYGVALGIIEYVRGIVDAIGGLVDGAAKVPGIGDKFAGAAAGMRTARDFMASLSDGFKDLTSESWRSAQGQDAFGVAIAGARGVVQTMQSEIAKASITVGDHAAVTKRAGEAKAEYVARTKEQEAADKAAAKAAEKFAESVTGMTRGWTELRPAVADAGAEIRNIAAGLEGNGTIVTRTIGETAQLRAESLEWARVNNATLAPSIKAVTAEMVTAGQGAASFRSAMSAAFKDLPRIMLGAIQGGGDVGKAVGASLGGSLGEWAGKAAGPALGRMFGSTVGGSIGTMFGPIGTAVGGFLGEKIGNIAGSLFGKAFKSEGKKVNDLRDGFVEAAGGIHELNVRAQAAGLTLDRLLRAKTVKDYTAAVDELNAAFGKQEADLELAREAMDEWGITATEAGQKFAQADMDKTSGRMKQMLDAAIASGVDLSAIALKAGDDFGKMAHQAIRTGTTIPASFRPAMAAMIEAGTLIDENGEKFTDLSQIPFAEDIGEGIKGIGSTLRELADFFMKGAIPAFQAAGAAGVGFARSVREAVADIPRKIEIEVDGSYNPPDIGSAGPGYSVGTHGRHGSYFVDFPDEGVTTRLHGREAVITEDQAPGFVADWLRRAGMATARGADRMVQAATGGVLSLSVLVETTPDGGASARVISEAERFRREHNRQARAGRLLIPVRAVGVV